MINLPSWKPPEPNVPLPKPAKRSGANARKQRVEASAEAPVEIKPAKAKPERKPIGARLRAMVLERDGFKCVRCGVEPGLTGVQLDVDHILPVAQGGTNCESNLQTLCKACNSGKGARREPIDNTKIVRQLAELVGKKPKAEPPSVQGDSNAKQRRADSLVDDGGDCDSGGAVPQHGLPNARGSRTGSDGGKRGNRPRCQ